MKYVLIFSILINMANAQTGIKTSTAATDKRVLICCGKATNITTAPTTTTTKPNLPISQKVIKQ
jgi:hypothetical protein